jgi:N-acetylmuramoyl-L-alanine amidase
MSQVLKRPSPNWNARPPGVLIDTVVMHATESRDTQQDIAWLCRVGGNSSSHVVIDRDGTIYDLVPVTRAAWHAGKSLFDNRSNVNAFSIGVELANDNVGEVYPDAQLLAAAVLVAGYIREWPAITVDRITTHAHIRASWLAQHPGTADVKTDPHAPFDLDAFKDLVREELER